MGVLDMAVDTMVDTVDTMASVRLRLKPRLRLILTTMEDMVMEDMVDMVLDIAADNMVDTVLDMDVDTMVDTVDTMASVGLRLSPRPRLRLIPTTMGDMAMEDMEGMAVDTMVDIAVDTMVDMAVDTMVDMAVDTMAMDMVVKKLQRYWYLDFYVKTVNI